MKARKSRTHPLSACLRNEEKPYMLPHTTPARSYRSWNNRVAWRCARISEIVDAIAIGLDANWRKLDFRKERKHAKRIH